MDGSIQYDHDWIVVGSGFGGSVASLRLAEKGYDVTILECGRRFEDKDFAESMYKQPGRYFWHPYLKMKGIFRMTFFKDLVVLTGSGVGGGSLGYACTLYRARDKFFEDKQWAAIDDWRATLAPHYDTAERMLGVTQVPVGQPSDDVIRELAADFGVADTYKKTNVGVYFGDDPVNKKNQKVPDPYFDGDGPERTTCNQCGACMMGCRFGAKNTLVKNYLWFAEKLGVKISPLRTVTDIRPLTAADGKRDGSGGYEVESVRTGAWFFKDRGVKRARGVVVAAGALGTNKLLLNCKLGGSLARLSDKLGELVRTNSEAILAATAADDSVDYSTSVAISSSFYPDEDTHIENVTYGHGGDAMGGTFTLLTGEGTSITRPLKFLAAILRSPASFAKTLNSHHWSRRTVILLVMQTLDNSINFRPKRKSVGTGWLLTTEEDAANPNPRYIAAANKAAELTAKRIDGVAQSSIFEVFRNTPTTAHILGGAVIGSGPENGVIDEFNRAYGYENLLITDGAAMPANPGVNPSLTITAIAEHAMTAVPDKPGAKLPRPAGRQIPNGGTGTLIGRIQKLGGQLAELAWQESKRFGEIAKTVVDTGILSPTHPRVMAETGRALRKWGPTQPAGYAISAVRLPNESAIVDELGTLTNIEVHRRTNQLAHALHTAGITEQSRVAILCRNHRGFIEAFVATLKNGADGLLLNTAFAGPQLVQVINDQKADVVIMDEEYIPMLEGALEDRPVFIAWHDSDPDKLPYPTLESLLPGQSTSEPPKPSRTGRTIILTSGTTGKPKGAARAEPRGLAGLLAVVTIIPYRYRSRALVSAPLFHTWGFAQFTANMMFNGTVVLRRHFDPEDVLRTIEREQVDMWAVVPVMLQRMLDLPDDAKRRYNLRSLRAVTASGSALPGELASEFMDEFGDVLYNLYGSTEAAWVTVASPKDMRAAPGTAGRVPTGTVVKILDEDSREVPAGETGQVFVKHDMVFEGYTGGEEMNEYADMVGTGDLGHMDSAGRLFIDGRIDEMIVSGGENVYPIEVEDVIVKHEAVYEAVVVGVDDEEFGARLMAFVVRANGAKLTEDALKKYVKNHLARFKVPRDVVFLDELPRNATGKVLKRELRELS